MNINSSSKQQTASSSKQWQHHSSTTITGSNRSRRVLRSGLPHVSSACCLCSNAYLVHETNKKIHLYIYAQPSEKNAIHSNRCLFRGQNNFVHHMVQTMQAGLSEKQRQDARVLATDRERPEEVQGEKSLGCARLHAPLNHKPEKKGPEEVPGEKSLEGCARRLHAPLSHRPDTRPPLSLLVSEMPAVKVKLRHLYCH